MFAWMPVLALLASTPEDIEASVKRFIEIFALVEDHAADPVSAERAFYEGAIPGMMKRLDPHSAFFDPGQFDQLKELENSIRKGFGSVVSVLPGRVVVLQTLAGAPSARAGIAPGDEILAINNIALNRLEPEQLIAVLSQARQKPAHLVVRRYGNARLLEFTLIPEDMQAPTVERVFTLTPGVGYVRVTSFDVHTGKEIRSAIERLGGAKLKALVLDLRNNTGGVMGAALEAASLFLEPGRKLVSVKGRAASVAKDIEVPAGQVRYEFPVAVLINGKSASAAEIVTGALQDQKRAMVLGEVSFGKGLVQSVYPLSQNTGIALTTAFYYTPSGRSIQKPLPGSQLDAATKRETQGGIQPDLVVYPEANSRLGMVIEATGSFTSFATSYRDRVRTIPLAFEVTPAILDEFQAYLSERQIRPAVVEWSRDREWIRSRLKQEIFNQQFGVERGDEIELERDPVVLRAR
ncbi:MAG TPA: S41 family peptidase, partial [Solibacterales bacterium]|nr:S41 family peptidase [Bryobacterales bacterium]